MSFYAKDGQNLDDRYLGNYEVVDRLTATTLWSWGSNAWGQLGEGTQTNRIIPRQESGEFIGWTTLAEGGTEHSAGIRSAFGLVTWGYNNTGQLGTNNTTHYSSPVQTVAGTGLWRQVCCGEGATVAVKTDGTLWTWGYNDYGQLGDGTTVMKSSPVQTIAGGNNWKKAMIGAYSVVALKTDGTLWCWGLNDWGQHGRNDTTNRSSPVQTIAGGTTWKDIGVGGNRVHAIKTDGTLWCWGTNTAGQLGTGNLTPYSSPVQTVAAGTNWRYVAGSRTGGNTLAIKTDGTLWVWGLNDKGQLGTNNTTSYSSPVQTVAAGTNWKHVSTGNGHSAAIKTDGSIWTWGWNDVGQLGDNTTTSKSSPVQVNGSSGWSWKQVMCGGKHTNALRNL